MNLCVSYFMKQKLNNGIMCNNSSYNQKESRRIFKELKIKKKSSKEYSILYFRS